jgi:uridylate kinase
MDKQNLNFNRILLKISGEVLSGDRKFGIDPSLTQRISKKIKTLHDLNIQIGIVIGGGNIFRGMSVSEQGMDRVPADYVGMMATLMNSVALQSELEKLGCDTRVMSALSVTQLAEPYIRRRATRHLEKNRIVIFAGGTGNPYFTTDTAAALRGIEIKANVIIKGTKVDGIYSSDPIKDKKAVKYDNLTFKEVIEKELRVMDMTAFTLCKENNLPIVVLNINDKECLSNLVQYKKIGTLVS